MRAKATFPFLAATILAALLLPGVAGAAARPVGRHSRHVRRTPPSVVQQIALHGTNGFEVSVSVHDRRELSLSAASVNAELAFQTASYKLPVRMPRGSDEIKARIGNLGRVDMRFLVDATKEVAPTLPTCRGGKTVVEEGHWVGFVSFRGEDDFTQVSAHHANGSITKAPALECPQPSAAALKKIEKELEASGREKAAESEADNAQETELVAVARPKVGFAATRVSAEQGGKKFSLSSFAVAGFRHRGRIEEAGSVLILFGKGSDFQLADSREPTSGAVVKPPAPFSGSATFSIRPEGRPSWDGDLKVELPGFGIVPLAGGDTRAVMCETLSESCGRGLGGRASSLLLDRLPR